jgi:hypothetical protein
LGNKISITECEGHQSYINSTSFDHEECVLAVVSDDLNSAECGMSKMRVTRGENWNLKSTFSSPGMSVLDYFINMKGTLKN